jgi:hypothetical protein
MDNNRIYGTIPLLSKAEIIELNRAFQRIDSPINRQIYERIVFTVIEPSHQSLVRILFNNLRTGEFIDPRSFISCLCAFTTGPFSQRLECHCT